MYFFTQVDPQSHILLCFLSCAIQPCCRSDGNSGLEVHGGVSPTPGGRSLPLPGFSPVPFSWTPTQAPQTILTASLSGISTHTHSHKHSHTTNHHVSPLTHRTNIPLAVTYYTYLHPAPRHFSPIHSCCICSSWTVRENDDVTGRGGSGRVGQVGLWSGCCCLQGNHNQPLSSPQSWHYEVWRCALFHVWGKILRHPVSSF